jgi:RNA polymerase sigma-70 factor (ECF subfamily)
MTDQREKHGFEEEALPYMDAVYRFALRLAGSADQAEDLVQETFLRAYRAWDQYTAGTNIRSWLFTICRNVFLRQRERGQRHDQIVSRESARDVETSGGSVVNPVWASTLGRDPEGKFFASIVDEEVLRAIDDLSEDYRSALVMSDLEGLSYQEISEALEVPVGTVKSRLFRARRQLQMVLYEYALEMGYIAPRTVPAGGGA